MKENIFTSPKAIRTIDLLRIIYLITAVFAFFFTEAGRFVYRPYIYENNINDFGLADSVGNWGGIIVQVFFMLAIFNSPFRKFINLLLFIVVGYILYEALQTVLPRGVFDWKDVYGSIIGGFISLIIFYLYHYFFKEKNKIYFYIDKKQG